MLGIDQCFLFLMFVYLTFPATFVENPKNDIINSGFQESEQLLMKNGFL